MRRPLRAVFMPSPRGWLGTAPRPIGILCPSSVTVTSNACAITPPTGAARRCACIPSTTATASDTAPKSIQEDSDLWCGICKEPLMDAHQAPCCGGLGCRACLEHVACMTKCCPFCREAFVPGSALRDVRTDRRAAQVMRPCPEDSCAFVGTRDGVAAHAAQCVVGGLRKELAAAKDAADEFRRDAIVKGGLLRLCQAPFLRDIFRNNSSVDFVRYDLGMEYQCFRPFKPKDLRHRWSASVWIRGATYDDDRVSATVDVNDDNTWVEIAIRGDFESYGDLFVSLLGSEDILKTRTAWFHHKMFSDESCESVLRGDSPAFVMRVPTAEFRDEHLFPEPRTFVMLFGKLPWGIRDSTPMRGADDLGPDATPCETDTPPRQDDVACDDIRSDDERAQDY